MLLAVFLIICAAVFPVQLLLCFRTKSLWKKSIPLACIQLYIVICLIFAFRPGWIFSGEDGRLAALIAAFIGFQVLLVDIMAWIIWGIVNYVQKRRK